MRLNLIRAIFIIVAFVFLCLLKIWIGFEYTVLFVLATLSFNLEMKKD